MRYSIRQITDSFSRPTTPFEKVMNAYCEKQGQNIGSLRFFFDDHRIQKTDTPGGLEMEEDDCIDVHQEQLGGDGSADVVVCLFSALPNFNVLQLLRDWLPAEFVLFYRPNC